MRWQHIVQSHKLKENMEVFEVRRNHLCSSQIHGFWALYIPDTEHKFHSRNELSSPYTVPLASHIVPSAWSDKSMSTSMETQWVLVTHK